MNKYLLGLLLLGYLVVIGVYAQSESGESSESSGEDSESSGEDSEGSSSEGENDSSNVGDSAYFVDYFYFDAAMEYYVPNPYPLDMCVPYMLDSTKYVKYSCETNNLVMKYVSTDSSCSNMTVDSWYFVNSSAPGDINSFQCLGSANYIGLKAYCGLSNQKTIYTVPGVCYYDSSNPTVVARWTCNFDDSIEFSMYTDSQCTTRNTDTAPFVFDSESCERLWSTAITGNADVNITIGTGTDFMCYDVSTRVPTSAPTEEASSMMISAFVGLLVGSLSSLLQ